MPRSQSCSQSSQNITRAVLENFNELVNRCVRFFLYRAGGNLPIRKIDIQKQVLKNVGRHFDAIIKKVTEVLKNVYGYDLYVSEDGGSIKQYMVSNTLPYRGVLEITPAAQVESSDEDEQVTGALAPDTYKILIMLILTHIFMNNYNASEASLFGFLNALQIDPNRTHEIFGNVKDFISLMVKQKYLRTETEELTRRINYFWGTRADHEISKHELLKFVCKMYRDRTPKSWTAQFENANVQLQAGRIVNGANEDDDDD